MRKTRKKDISTSPQMLIAIYVIQLFIFEQLDQEIEVQDCYLGKGVQLGEDRAQRLSRLGKSQLDRGRGRSTRGTSYDSAYFFHGCVPGPIL